MNAELATTFDRLVSGLEDLTRDHLLYFRVQTGRLVATTLFGGDIATMRAQLTQRDGVLAAFVHAQAQRLDDLGLSEEQLRQSLHAWAVVELLPAAIAQGLQFTHVLELTKVHDDQTRAILAKATLDNGWSRRALRDAIEDVQHQRWPDHQPEAPGLQPSAAPTAVERPTLAPGRMLTRFEKTADEVTALAGQWAHVDVGRLSPAQKRRARAALQRLRAQVDALEAGLA